MESEPPNSGLILITFSIYLITTWGIIILVGLLLLLIISSALISGSEVAYFSIKPGDISLLREEKSKASQRVLSLKEYPQKLLATILISNNFINIAIVILSDYLLRSFFSETTFLEWGELLNSKIDYFSVAAYSHFISFSITVMLVTFFLVLFGEVTPKIYANLYRMSFAKTMSKPLLFLNRVFSPLSNLMVSSSEKLERKLNSNVSLVDMETKEELDKAIELTVSQEDSTDEEADILKGIIKFNDVTVKQIMKSRVDVVALDIDSDYKIIAETIKETGYSRLPVYKEDFDNIEGMLYVKDLLDHSAEPPDYKWQKHIRENILYVPEAKKLNDLLKEFQKKKMHLGIVVDEYGGSAGIVTLEDVMEEVLGDMTDEFDDQEHADYIKINDHNYIFEGKTMLNDVCRIIGEDTEVFTKIRGDADSLAGILLEQVGQIPKIDAEIEYENFKFKVISASKKRIEKVKITIVDVED